MKKIAMTLIAGGLLLTACSESESEGFTSANTPIELSTIDELKRFTCDESLNGIEVFVEEKDASFVCDQEENGTWGWTRSNSSTRDSSTSKYSSSNARHLSDLQAAAIVAMRLGALTGLEHGKLTAERDQLEASIAEFVAILGSVELQL